MLLFDDATGQREPDTPAARLVGRARLEELILHLGPDSGPIIAHADPTNGIAAFHLDLDPTAAAAQRVDRILHDDLERPLDEHRIPGRHRPRPGRVERDRHRMRERRQARAEVRHHPFRDQAQTHGLAPRRPADPLEPLGHAFEPLRVRFKMRDELAAGCIRILPEVINPTREAHERRAQLMRRLPCHRDPEPVAGRGDALAHRPRRQDHEAQEHRALQDGESRECPGRRQGAVVDRTDARLDQGRLDPVELGDPVPPRRRARVCAEWRIVEGRDPPRRVGHGNGDAEPPDFVGEGEQRVRGGALARIVQPGKDVPQQPAGLARVAAEVTSYNPGVTDRQDAEQQRGGEERGRPRATQRATGLRQVGQCRHKALTPEG